MSMICPVCSDVAEDLVVGSEEGVECECPQCGRFAVSEASTVSLGRYARTVRRGLLSAAILRTPPGGMPVISHVD